MSSSVSSSDSVQPGQALGQFMQRVAQALREGRCDRVMLTNHHGQDHSLQRVLARPIDLRGQPCLSMVWRHQTKDVTQNLPHEQALARLAEVLGMEAFRNAHLFTGNEEVQLAFSKKGKASVRVGKLSSNGAAHADQGANGSSPGGHNQEKQRHLDLARPFLRELGVTDAQGQLIPAMSRKWKQINKFVEVFSHALAKSRLAGQQQVHVVDFGSGKGYLTFAVHDWLRQVQGRDARVTGVELREDLVKLCQGVIGRLQLEGMDYEQGDVRHYHPAALDVMIALHACDVATDYAIHLGVRAGAEIIMCSPCCHKQIRPQLLSPHPLKPILQHGIHLGQQAEMLTDGLRALLLEAAGYDTQVFEFISLEHTNKNKMILAVKRAKGASDEGAGEVVNQIRDIKAFYGIHDQCLEGLLKADGLLPA